MSREIRRVPANWQHPKDRNGHLVPLLADYQKRVDEWDEGFAKWKQGFKRNFDGTWASLAADQIGKAFEDWTGERPRKADYMPEWPDAERTHICMYETCTEGTPISPVCATPEECARWLADNNASAFGDMRATYQQWLATCRRGWAAGLFFGGGKPAQSGVELNGEIEKEVQP